MSQPFTIEKEGLKIAILNFTENEWSSATKDKGGANPLDIIDNVRQIKTAKANHDKVICVIHGGHEHYNLPSPRMQKQNRFYAKMVQISLSDIIPIALEDMRFTKAFLFITVWVTFCLP